MNENVAEIEGHLYRYAYDPGTQKTVYKGPVGDGPALSEEDFFRRMQTKNSRKEMLRKIDPYYREQIENLMSGEPIKVYHGTTRNFDNFELDRSRTWMNEDFQGDGLFFSLDKDTAEDYAHASRQASLHPDVLDEIGKSKPNAARFMRNIYQLGYENGWEKNFEHFGIDNLRENNFELDGVDGDELSDLVNYIEGAKIDPTKGEDMAIFIFSMETKSFHESELQTLRELGVEKNFPTPQVYVAELQSEDVWITNDKNEAKVWDHDVVVYFGSDIVGDVPEIIVHRDSLPVTEKILLEPLEVVYG